MAVLDSFPMTLSRLASKGFKTPALTSKNRAPHKDRSLAQLLIERTFLGLTPQYKWWNPLLAKLGDLAAWRRAKVPGRDGFFEHIFKCLTI